MEGKIRFLLVDDNEQDRALVRRELARDFAHAEIVEAADQATFESALSHQSPFDVVVTDYQLRFSNGQEILAITKQRSPESVVIMFTATGTQEVAVEAMKAGLDDYIIKSPSHLVRLTIAISSALKRREIARKKQELETRLQTLLEQVRIGIFRASSDGQFLESNEAFLRLVGVSSLEEANALDLPTLKTELLSSSSSHQKEILLSLPSHRSVWVLLTYVKKEI